MLHATNNTFANIPYYGCLPMMQTNFGGDLQLCTIEPYAGYNIGYNLNPVAQQTWGGSIFTEQAARCYAANPFGNGGGCSSTPVSSGIPTPGTQGFNDAVRRGAAQIVAPILNNMTSQNLNRCLANIQQAKTALEAQLTNTNITDEQKKQVNDMLDKVKAQEDELKKIAESSDLDPKTAYEKVGEQEKALRQILVDTSKLIKDINASASSSTGETTTTSTGETTTAGETTTTATTGTAATHSATTPEGASTDESSDPQGVDDFSIGTKKAVDQFFNAVNGAGTDDEKMTEVLDYMAENPDEGIKIMLCWNKRKSNVTGGSMMKAFMEDADSWFGCRWFAHASWFGANNQKQEYGQKMVDLLKDKAEELGIYDECKKDFGAIEKELTNSFFAIDNDIYKNYDNVLKKIADKMGSKNGSPDVENKTESK